MLKQIKLESGDIAVIHPEVVGHLSGWIDSLYRASKDLPKFGILSALILDVNKKIYFHGGEFLPYENVPLGNGMGEEYLGQYPGTRQTQVVPLYCAIISKELVKKFGIPETAGTSIFEDANYCLQAIANGFNVYSTDKLAVVYQGTPDSGLNVKQWSDNFTSDGAMFKARWDSVLASNYKNAVLYMAKGTGPSGFARAALGYLRGLHNNGIRVYFESLDTVREALPETKDEFFNSILTQHGDMNMPQVTWGQAPYFIRNSGSYKIGHCEFEATTAPESWIDYCNMMDEIWVPTNWDRAKFLKAGVNCPIYVIHQGIDPNYFHPNIAPMQTDAKESYKFLVNAAWFPRKNLRNLILAFQAEFRKGEDVCLVVKTLDLGLNKGIKEELKSIPNDNDSANVYVKEEALDDYKMPSLYTMADCFVLPSRGEGWGLPLFESLACGVPVITTGYGAPYELLRDDDDAPFPGVKFIDYKDAISREPYVYIENLLWAEPSLPHLQTLMREAYNNQATFKMEALATSEIIREKFSWDNVCKPICDRLEDIYKNKLTKKI